MTMMDHSNLKKMSSQAGQEESSNKYYKLYCTHISSFINAICVGNVTPEAEHTTRCIFSSNVKRFFLVTHSPGIRTTLPNPPTSLGKICSLQGKYLGLFQNSINSKHTTSSPHATWKQKWIKRQIKKDPKESDIPLFKSTPCQINTLNLPPLS